MSMLLLIAWMATVIPTGDVFLGDVAECLLWRSFIAMHDQYFRFMNRGWGKLVV